MVESLLLDKSVQQSINNLRRMGLRVVVEELDDNVVLVAVDIESIIDVIRRKIEKSMTYSKFKIVYDREEELLGIYLWRREMPQWLREELKEKEETL